MLLRRSGLTGAHATRRHPRKRVSRRADSEADGRFTFEQRRFVFRVIFYSSGPLPSLRDLLPISVNSNASSFKSIHKTTKAPSSFPPSSSPQTPPYSFQLDIALIVHLPLHPSSLTHSPTLSLINDMPAIRRKRSSAGSRSSVSTNGDDVGTSSFSKTGLPSPTQSRPPSPFALPTSLRAEIPSAPVSTQRRRVNPESLAARLGPEVVAELEKHIEPGNIEMPSFAVRRAVQVKFSIDRRHIYDFYHSKGLRCLKDEKVPAKATSFAEVCSPSLSACTSYSCSCIARATRTKRHPYSSYQPKAVSTEEATRSGCSR